MYYYYLISEGSYSDYGPRFIVCGPEKLTEDVLTSIYQKSVTDYEVLREKFEKARVQFSIDNDVSLESPWSARTHDKVNEWGALNAKWQEAWRAFYQENPYPEYPVSDDYLISSLHELGFDLVEYEEFNLDHLPVTSNQ